MTNIYYIEDSPNDYSIYYDVLSKLKNTCVYPEPDDWGKEIDKIKEFIDDPPLKRDEVLKLFTTRAIDIFIIDEFITHYDDGTTICTELLLGNPSFPNLKVIIFTLATDNPIVVADRNALITISYKFDDDIKQTAHDLLVNLKSLAGLKVSFIKALKDALNKFNQFLEND